MDETHVVTCFLRNRDKVLALRRSGEVGSYPGKWGGVAGHAEGDPDAAARTEVAEETGLAEACRLVRTGEPFPVEDHDLGVRWVVHPYLFDCERRDVDPNRETAGFEWLHPTDLLDRETVPDLWRSYERVAPTVESVRTDDEHGSAYVSVRALEVLRDRAGALAAGLARADGNAGTGGGDADGGGTDDWSVLAALATDLLAARPGMAAVGNRVNRAMAEAADERTPEAVERAAREGIERAVEIDAAAAETAADLLDGWSVLTLSRSGTVLGALPAADRVFVAESRPAREGVGVAERLAGDAEVVFHTDAAVAHLLATADVDAVVVGADGVLPDGRVVNKTGTRGTALAAARERCPVYAVAATDKVRTDDDDPHLEAGDPAEIYDGEADVSAVNPTFDVTPADLVAGVVTERGVLDPDGVSAVADELRALSRWRGTE